MNQLQCCPAGEPEWNAGQRTPHSAEVQADFEESELPLALGWETINIGYLQEMAVQRFRLDQRAEGRLTFTQVRRAAAGKLIRAISWSSIRTAWLC